MHRILTVDSADPKGAFKMCTCLKADNTTYSALLTVQEVELYLRLAQFDQLVGSTKVDYLRKEIDAFVEAKLAQQISNEKYDHQFGRRGH